MDLLINFRICLSQIINIGGYDHDNNNLIAIIR